MWIRRLWTISAVKTGSLSIPSPRTAGRACSPWAEAAKLHLSQTDMALPMVLREGEQSWGARLDRKTLRTLCDPLFARAGTVIARAVRDSGMSAGELDGVVLVGGSSRMAVFQEYLTELLSGAPSLVGNPDHIVAQGAGLCAGIKQRAEGLRDVVHGRMCARFRSGSPRALTSRTGIRTWCS